MKSTVLLAFLFLNACAGSTKPESSRSMASAQKIQAEGRWAGVAVFTKYAQTPEQIHCSTIKAEIDATGESCAIYTQAGNKVHVQMACADDSLAPEKQNLFSKELELCEVNQQLNGPAGMKAWSNLLVKDTNEGADSNVTASLLEKDGISHLILNLAGTYQGSAGALEFALSKTGE